MGGREHEAAAIATRKQVGLTFVSALPYRPDGVDDPFAWQCEGRGDAGFAGGAASDRSAVSEKRRARGAVYRPVNAAPAQ